MLNVSVSGSGYEEAIDSGTGDSVYIHRLVAVAEHGYDEVAGKDVHHMNLFDGRSEPTFNARDAVVPEERVSHRSRTLNNVSVAAD